MSHFISLANALIVTALVGGGVYLHRIDGRAKETLAEASRINLESQERFKKIQASMEELAAERQQVEARDAQLLRETAERENRLRIQTISSLESQSRQAEQTHKLQQAQQELEAERLRLNQSRSQAEAAQRQYEDNLNRLAVAQRRQEERQRQEDHYRAYQAATLAAAEERARRFAQAAATPHVIVRTAPTTVVWQKPLPTHGVRHVDHHPAKTPNPRAEPSRPCRAQAIYKAGAILPGNCR